VSTVAAVKPLGRKAYGSIGHLPDSRLGPGDHAVTPGQASICTTRKRDKHDSIVVQEKLDGSCVSVAKVGGQIIPLGRAGYPASTSKYEQHVLFHRWAMDRQHLFDRLLGEGERLVGEWLAQAHGTRYRLPRGPFIAFDLMTGQKRVPHEEFAYRVRAFPTPTTLSSTEPIQPQEALATFARLNTDGAIDPIEGVVYRVHRKGNVDFLAKWVRSDKVDGCYLPEISGGETIWNWRDAPADVMGGRHGL